MKCAYCSNENDRFLRDEGDTFYCLLCHRRTDVKTGKESTILCPFCHRMRDPKAAFCRFCGNSDWRTSTEEEFNEINQILKDIGY